MNFWRVSAASGLILIPTLTISLSCSTEPRTLSVPRIPEATLVGNNACRDCHAPVFKTFNASIHARVSVDRSKLPGGTSCESCHGPGSRHVQSGGGRGKFIVNPGQKPESCFACHLDIQSDFRLPHHHPVIENKMNCVQCHEPHGSDVHRTKKSLAISRLNESCAECHREQTRPFVFEHEALREGCTICHQPHGSANTKMLLQRDANLCLKCHAQVAATGRGSIFIGHADHTAFLKRGTCWTSGCHTAVHGSNIHPKMFQ